nr:hypothetical protein Iba_chr02cCG11080 [Ipomoea batatas]
MELSIVRSLPCIVTSPSSSEVPTPPPVTAVFPLDDASPPFAALILFLAHRVRSVPCVFVMAKLSFSGGCRLSNKASAFGEDVDAGVASTSGDGGWRLRFQICELETRGWRDGRTGSRDVEVSDL